LLANPRAWMASRIRKVPSASTWLVESDVVNDSPT